MTFMSRFSGSAVAFLGALWLCLVPLSAAQAAILITIDKAAQKMTVDVDGATRWVWPVSTGRRGYDTPAGSFRPFRMEEDHYSKEWDDAPMPYSIFFTGEGHAIHGSYETRNLGRPASHGCVRIAPQNATILYELVRKNGMENTKVMLSGETPGGEYISSQSPPYGRAGQDFAPWFAPEHEPFLTNRSSRGLRANGTGQQVIRSPMGPSSRAPSTSENR